MDLEFHVIAPVFGAIDRTLLVTDGETYAAALGVGGPLFENGQWSTEVFYSPLEVKRPENDDFLNVRFLYSISLK